MARDLSRSTASGLIAILMLSVAAHVASAQPSPGESPPAPAASPAAPDWDRLNTEALDYFRRYLQFDTSNPLGNTADAIGYLQQILEKEGIATETFAAKPGKVNLVAHLPGPAGLKPFMMMSHADVVPAVAEQWSHPPFGADLANGFVYARGAIDNKAHGIMALMTMLALKRQNIALRRGVVMMVNADEEVGGEEGARWMADNHWDAIDSAFAVNEGGIGRPHMLGSRGITFPIGVAEKRVMWLRLAAHGKAGHGSVPTADNPNVVLVNALQRLLASQPPIRLTEFIERSMKDMVPRLSPPASTELAHLNDPAQLQAALAGPLAEPSMQAVLRDTISLTMLNAGIKANVIPSTAEATLDCRLLPGTDADQFLDRMRKTLDDKRISIDYIQRPDSPPPSPAEGEAWSAIARIVTSEFPDAIAVPSMGAGGTDSRFMRMKGVPAYGFIPIVLDQGEIGRFHGVDERLSVENLDRGVRATYDLAIELCGPPQ